MGFNFLEGAEISHTNSGRLEATARIIVKDEDGTDSFGLFLYYIAFEEMAKAVFCLFVHKGWITEEFVKPVFIDHKAKIFLFDEFFRTFEVHEGRGFLGGKPLGDKSFKDFKSQYEEEIKHHRDFTNDLLYVDMENDDWISPKLEMKNFAEEESKIKKKIEGLASAYEILLKHIDKNSKNFGNFKFIVEEEGRYTMQWDTI